MRKKNSAVGIFGTSLKEDESRLPIHPESIRKLPTWVRKQVVLERDYGSKFGYTNEDFAEYVSDICPRKQMLAECEILVLPKVTETDLKGCKDGATIFGWAHCVQQVKITQLAIDKKLNIVAWESMYEKNRRSKHRSRHVFEANNEIAGYCAVLHALSLAGMTGRYGPPKSAFIVCHGSVSKGAIKALKASGVESITVATRREVVADLEKGLRHVLISKCPQTNKVLVCDGKPIAQHMANHDIIVNGILQDPIDPWNFMTTEDARRLKRGSLIIDISCDQGMGFEFAMPTTFRSPTFKVQGSTYYAVDHTPTYLWNTATSLISEEVVFYLPRLMLGLHAALKDRVLGPAFDILEGNLLNPRIGLFQNRKSTYPHSLIKNRRQKSAKTAN